jgi:hypothetical protein
MKVLVRKDPPPLDTRDYDWRAVAYPYTQGDRIGWGRTQKRAIANLLDQLGLDPDTAVEIQNESRD